jgi:hypothetical protein
MVRVAWLTLRAAANHSSRKKRKKPWVYNKALENLPISSGSRYCIAGVGSASQPAKQGTPDHPSQQPIFNAAFSGLVARFIHKFTFMPAQGRTYSTA